MGFSSVFITLVKCLGFLTAGRARWLVRLRQVLSTQRSL